MNQLALISTPVTLPALIAAAGDRASHRVLELFAANIRNLHTRRAYGRAVAEFLAWCDDNRVPRSQPCGHFTSPPGSRCSSRLAEATRVGSWAGGVADMQHPLSIVKPRQGAGDTLDCFSSDRRLCRAPGCSTSW
jgi:hypothetical protein